MPSSFARHQAVVAQFDELIAMLKEDAPPGRGEAARKWVEMLRKVETARGEFVALGNPQSGSSG